MYYCGRFAPSPTGPLHFGSLVTAVASYLRARAANGRWLVRIDDIDPPREVVGAAHAIVHTLRAFGMISDAPVVYQSQRTAAYQAAFDRLLTRGAVFPCRCTRTMLAAVARVHRGVCLDAPSEAQKAAAWRLRADHGSVEFHDLIGGIQSQNIAMDVGDFVVLRVEGWFAYQLAVVVDDADAGITEVVRGLDLLDSTPRQIYLQRMLGLPTPQYAHVPLVLNADGTKLSKRDRAQPLRDGDPLPALYAALEFLGLEISQLGQHDNVASLLRAATPLFDLDAIRVRGAPQSDPE